MPQRCSEDKCLSLSLLMDSSHSPISLEIKRLHPKCEGVVLIEQCPSEKQWGLVCMMRWDTQNMLACIWKWNFLALRPSSLLHSLLARRHRAWSNIECVRAHTARVSECVCRQFVINFNNPESRSFAPPHTIHSPVHCLRTQRRAG